MPGTDGGSSTKTKASRMANILLAQVAQDLVLADVLLFALLEGFSATKITPALGALVKVAPSKPAKATASRTPWRDVMMSPALRITASVRSSVDAGRQAERRR